MILLSSFFLIIDKEGWERSLLIMKLKEKTKKTNLLVINKTRGQFSFSEK